MARKTPLDAPRRAVESHLAALPQGSTVLVACSGGADSLALAAATRNAADHRGYRAGAVIVDHGLLAGSAEVARRAAQQCTDLGLEPVEVQAVAVQAGGGGGPEARARTARYRALRAAADAAGATAIMLGHTLDDQAENVLLSLARGSGARSLAGMSAVNGLWHRPFLGITRRQTEQACEFLGIEYWIDPTNAGTAGDPVRSRLRAHAMPALIDVLGAEVPGSLARSASLLRADADYLEAEAQRLVERAAAAARIRPAAQSEPGAGGAGDMPVVTADAAELKRAHGALVGRALRTLAIAAGARPGSLTHNHVRSLAQLIENWHGQGPVALPGSVFAARDCGTLVFTRSNAGFGS
ncbi:tRNA lysidine(34) synthetase TilS [Rarobacter incanus]|uniref:tRNA(Ile)-lysidine synthase n=1 Tax=Rarobacter incanus TaxID=153494 RepID=A0A542SP80_9MICO|nr:tRNA lysidine(34) synthetase TilS [Rarobacter incanus]TQK76368.1 tRNA(Ile)-lysidine synthase [Rarobacter incanus]